MSNNSYLKIKEKTMMNEASLLQSITHPTTKGDHLENLLKNFLKEELPKRYSIDSGFIIGLLSWKKDSKILEDEKGKFRSKEVDVVIFDEQKNVSPLKLLRKRDFFVEQTHAIISIKKILDKSNFLTKGTSMLKNLISAKKIKILSLNYPVSNAKTTFDTEGSQVPIPIISAGFAYESKINLNQIKKNLEIELEKYKKWQEIFPDIIAVLGMGLVYKTGDDYASLGHEAKYEILEAKENTLEEFFIYLLSLLNNRETFTVGLIKYKDFYDNRTGKITRL